MQAPAALRIEPGASITAHWAGGFEAAMTMTGACFPGAGCQGGSCLRPTQAPAGLYFVELRTFRACEGACACEPTADGWCPIFDPVVVADATVASADLAYPEATKVEVVIGDP